MELLAASILLSTVLYLVDKNHCWPRFWRVVKWGSITGVAAIALVFGYMQYANHNAKASTGPPPGYEEVPAPSPASTTPAK